MKRGTIKTIQTIVCSVAALVFLTGFDAIDNALSSVERVKGILDTAGSCVTFVIEIIPKLIRSISVFIVFAVIATVVCIFALCFIRRLKTRSKRKSEEFRMKENMKLDALRMKHAQSSARVKKCGLSEQEMQEKLRLKAFEEDDM